MLLWTKSILIVLNTLLLTGALLTLIRYVRKTAEIAELSEESAIDIERTNAVSRGAVELSRKTLLEMRETRRLITAPLIVVYFERGDDQYASRLFFVVENIGGGVARNISYHFSPALRGRDAGSAERIVRLGANIDSLPADYRLINLFGRVGDYLDTESEDGEEINSDLPRRFDVALTFEDAVTGELYREKYSLDLRIPLGTCAQ